MARPPGIEADQTPDPQPEGDQEEDHPEPGSDGACRQEAHGLRQPRRFLGELGLEELEMLLEEPANVGDEPSPSSSRLRIPRRIGLSRVSRFVRPQRRPALSHPSTSPAPAAMSNAVIGCSRV